MADTALLVTTPDVVAVRAAKRMVRLWDRLQIRKAEETVTVVNRHTRSTEIQPQLVQRITGDPRGAHAGARRLQGAAGRVDAGRMQDLDAKWRVKQALWGLAGELGLAVAPDGRAASPGPALGAGSGRQQGSRRGGTGTGGAGGHRPVAGPAAAGTPPCRPDHRRSPGPTPAPALACPAPAAAPAGAGPGPDPGFGFRAAVASPGPGYGFGPASRSWSWSWSQLRSQP